MKQPRDTVLPHSEKLLVIACGMIAREVLAAKQQLGLDHLDLTCLPAEFHYYPDRIPPAMDTAIAKAKAEGYRHIFVGYADCGTGGLLDKVCEKHGVERIEGPHCYSFLSGNERFEKTAEEDLTTFFLTDYLARHFDKLIWEGLGIAAHPELLPLYFGNYTKLVYLAQTRDPGLEAKAQDAAARLGLDFELRFTGYGELGLALTARA